jgi:hypothetical protein
MPAVELRALRRNWDPESWHGDLWEDPDEIGSAEPLNSDEASYTISAVSPPHLIDPTLSKEVVMASPEAGASLQMRHKV